MQETPNNPFSQAMQARPKRLAAMTRRALLLQAATAKHLLAAKSSPVTDKALLVGNTSKLGTDVQRCVSRQALLMLVLGLVQTGRSPTCRRGFAGQGLARVMHMLQANPPSLPLSSNAAGGDAALQMQQRREKQHLPPSPPQHAPVSV